MPNTKKLKLSPPPFPNRDPYPFAATTRFRNMVIDLENLSGSVREGTDPNGKKWRTKFEGAHYGEIRGSKGSDGDPVDVYIKDPPDESTNVAYVIHQNFPRTHPTKGGQYDEDKVVLGVSSAEEAKALYLRHYNRKDFFRSVTEMKIEPFKRAVFGENKGEKVAMEQELQEYYKLGQELAVKLSAGVAQKPDWPKSMPKHGGPVTPVAELKKKMEARPPFKKNLVAQM